MKKIILKLFIVFSLLMIGASLAGCEAYIGGEPGPPPAPGYYYHHGHYYYHNGEGEGDQGDNNNQGD